MASKQTPEQPPERSAHPRAWTIVYVILLPLVVLAVVGTMISFRKRFADAYKKLEAGNAPVVIAILDTGVTAGTSPEFQKRLLKGHNFFDNNDDTTDEGDHGTRVA